MKKRKALLIPAVLILALLLAFPAAAASDSTANFVRSKTYGGQFSDLPESSIFYSNVSALYEYAFSVGNGDGTFGLNDRVTMGQAVTFAARIRSLYRTGSAEAGAAAFGTDENAYYAPYVSYLKSEGVIGSELDGAWNSPASRAAVAHVLANTLPSSALPAANADLVTKCYATGKFITDVTASTEYRQDILTLYQCGISQGSDGTGSFQPSATITRGELSAMLTRMVDPSLRVTPDWNAAAAYSAKGTTWMDLVFGDATYTAAPATDAQLAADVNYMLASGSNTLTLDFGTAPTYESINSVMTKALSFVMESNEHCYNSVSSVYSWYSSEFTLIFSTIDSTDDETAAYRSYTLAAAIAVHDRLWADGTITADMTQMEKARVYFDWICKNCTYDYSVNDISHIAYAVFKNGSAVCDGYTGAYDLLLKLEGISCRALSNDTHAWTVATLDGTEYHIDTTWGDQWGNQGFYYIDYSYFAMTADESWNYHSW